MVNGASQIAYLEDHVMYVSPADGYVRMSLAELQATPLTHLMSHLDEEEANEGGLALPITGYSEWISSGTPAITIGWDWQLQLCPDDVKLTVLHEPRSNIMLLDTQGSDLGAATTGRLLAEFVDSLAWRKEVMDELDIGCRSRR